jgi:hypothetical protein
MEVTEKVKEIVKNLIDNRGKLQLDGSAQTSTPAVTSGDAPSKAEETLESGMTDHSTAKGKTVAEINIPARPAASVERSGKSSNTTVDVTTGGARFAANKGESGVSAETEGKLVEGEFHHTSKNVEFTASGSVGAHADGVAKVDKTSVHVNAEGFAGAEVKGDLKVGEVIDAHTEAAAGVGGKADLQVGHVVRTNSEESFYGLKLGGSAVAGAQASGKITTHIGSGISATIAGKAYAGAAAAGHFLVGARRTGTFLIGGHGGAALGAGADGSWKLKLNPIKVAKDAKGIFASRRLREAMGRSGLGIRQELRFNHFTNAAATYAKEVLGKAPAAITRRNSVALGAGEFDRRVSKDVRTPRALQRSNSLPNVSRQRGPAGLGH